jgi:hypothetical protein
MNGTMYSQNPSNGYYTGNGQDYHNEYPSTFTPNIHLHQLYSPVRHENINSQHTFKPLPMQSDNDIQRPFYTNNLPSQQAAQLNVYNFENSGLASAAYYDHIHAQVRLHTPIYQHQNSTSTNSTSQYPYTHSPSPNFSRQPTPAIPNGQTEPNFLVISAAQSNISSPPLLVIH